MYRNFILSKVNIRRTRDILKIQLLNDSFRNIKCPPCLMITIAEICEGSRLHYTVRQRICYFAEDAKISVFDGKKGVPTNIKQTSINTHEQC